MEKKTDENLIDPSGAALPKAGRIRVSHASSKMDWIRELPFRQVRGTDLPSEETERFYHSLS
jgi:hypothetical protein